jgi:transcriptional regulator with XRE-family HTH domain
MTQAQLAERADLAVESISRLETGRLTNLTIDVAERLAGSLGVGLRDLFEPTVAPRRPGPRPIEKRILVMLGRLDDRDLEQVYQGLRRLLGVRDQIRGSSPE